jgi:hypothetical protein
VSAVGYSDFHFGVASRRFVHQEGTKLTKCHEDERSPEARLATESLSHGENAGLRALHAAPRSGGSVAWRL